MKQIFLLCLILLAALGPATAQKTGDKCSGVPYVSPPLNPNPTNVPLTPDSPPPPETTPPIEGYRGIYWVHGLGGDTGSWGQAADATDGTYQGIFGPVAGFPIRKAKCVLLSYQETVSLANAAGALLTGINNAEGQVDDVVDDFSNNFIIAHSQGGFVSRAVEKLLDDTLRKRQHYGVVTFGSPHKGAKIINSRNEGRIMEWLSDGCAYMIDAKVKDFLQHKPILAFFIDTDPITTQIENTCNFVSNFGLPFALDGLFTAVSNSYAIDSPAVTILNAHNNPHTRKVAFYGVEHNGKTDGLDADFDPTDDQYVAKQAVWRLASSKRANVSSLPPFGADGDQDMVDKANQITMELYGKYQEARQDAFNVPCIFFGIFDCIGAHLDAAEAYHRAYQWFNGADYVWKFLIGHRSYGVDPNGTGYCNGGPSHLDSYTMTQTQCGIAQGTWYPNTALIIKPSDGVVLAESAKTWPGVNAVGEPMKGSNHFQMRNDPQLKLRLKELYNGDVDDWFRLEEQ